MPQAKVEVTEIEEFEPTRVDGVGKGANGFPILMLKSIGDAIIEEETTLDEALKARPACDKCDGSGKVDDADCPKCKGSGKMPMVGDSAKATAPSGAEVDTPGACPTCGGHGALENGTTCADCDGTGNDGTEPSDAQLSTTDAPGPVVTEGDARETIDKADATTFAAANPALTSTAADDDATSSTDAASTPGSPEWEAIDAEIATAAAMALMEASDLIQKFAQREATEVAAGEGNDRYDQFDAQNALSAVSAALGIIARLAFHEGVEAQKSVDEEVEKAGKRLSRKTIHHMAATRDAITELLGDDDPAKSDDNATKKLSKEIEDMTLDELLKALDERDAARSESAAAAEDDAVKAEEEVAVETEEAPAAEAEVVADEAVEVEAEAAKAELTPEEIEANKVAKAAKKEAKAAKKAAKQVADEARVAALIEEQIAKATEAVEALKSELESVKKMAAPGGPAKTRPQDAINKSAERDAKDMEIARLEDLAKNTTESALRKGYADRAKELRAELASAK